MKIGQSQAKKSNKLKTDISLPTINCLVTGFDPFNDAYHNPSAAIAMSMPSGLSMKRPDLDVVIRKLVLPCVGDKAWSILKQTIDDLPVKSPAILIMLGLAANRKVISLERFALNFQDYKFKDNDGRIIEAQVIDRKAPEAFRTKAPIEEALKYFLSKGVPIEASNHAGTFVCNEMYFRALYYVSKLQLPHMVYFVHVPMPKEYGKVLAKVKVKRWLKLSVNKENQLKAMTEIIKMLIEFSAKIMAEK